MRLHLCRTAAAMAFTVLSGAAFADVMVSQSNDPSTLFGEQFSSLFGAEHAAVNSLADSQLTAVANGISRKGEALPGEADAIEYTEAWLAGLPEAKGDDQWNACARRCISKRAVKPCRGSLRWPKSS